MIESTYISATQAISWIAYGDTEKIIGERIAAYNGSLKYYKYHTDKTVSIPQLCYYFRDKEKLEELRNHTDKQQKDIFLEHKRFFESPYMLELTSIIELILIETGQSYDELKEELFADDKLIESVRNDVNNAWLKLLEYLRNKSTEALGIKGNTRHSIVIPWEYWHSDDLEYCLCNNSVNIRRYSFYNCKCLDYKYIDIDRDNKRALQRGNERYGKNCDKEIIENSYSNIKLLFSDIKKEFLISNIGKKQVGGENVRDEATNEPININNYMSKKAPEGEIFLRDAITLLAFGDDNSLKYYSALFDSYKNHEYGGFYLKDLLYIIECISNDESIEEPKLLNGYYQPFDEQKIKQTIKDIIGEIGLSEFTSKIEEDIKEQEDISLKLKLAKKRVFEKLRNGHLVIEGKKAVQNEDKSLRMGRGVYQILPEILKDKTVQFALHDNTLRVVNDDSYLRGIFPASFACDKEGLEEIKSAVASAISHKAAGNTSDDFIWYDIIAKREDVIAIFPDNIVAKEKAKKEIGRENAVDAVVAEYNNRLEGARARANNWEDEISYLYGFAKNKIQIKTIKKKITLKLFKGGEKILSATTRKTLLAISDKIGR